MPFLPCFLLSKFILRSFHGLFLPENIYLVWITSEYGERIFRGKFFQHLQVIRSLKTIQRQSPLIWTIMSVPLYQTASRHTCTREIAIRNPFNITFAVERIAPQTMQKKQVVITLFDSDFERSIGRKPKNQVEFDKWAKKANMAIFNGCLNWDRFYECAAYGFLCNKKRGKK